MIGYCNPCGRTQTLIAQDGKTVCANCLGDPHKVSYSHPKPPPRFNVTGPCPCECNRGGFCGGCGHAGCGGRRR